MGIGSGTALLIGGLASAGGGIASGILGSNAASNAAGAQAGAANYAANLQAQEANNALAFQQAVYNSQLANTAPFLQTGQAASSKLAELMGLSLPAAPAPLSVPGIGGAPGSSGAGTPSSSALSSQQITDALNGAGLNQNQYTQLASLLGQVDGDYNPDTTYSPHLPPPTTEASSVRPRIGAPSASPQQYQPSSVSGSPVAAAPGTTPPPGTVHAVGPEPVRPPITTTGGGAAQLGQPSDFGSLMQGWNQQFVAPTAATEQNDPGYQFRLQQGLNALQNSAAASGNLLTGNTGEALQNYGQDYASNEYNNVYNRALQQYQQSYNQFQQNQANQYNRLASLAGLGQVSAGQLNSAAGNAGSSVSNTLLGTGAQIGQDQQNAAAARASGYVGGANAIGGAINSGVSGLSGLIGLSSLLGSQGNANAGLNAALGVYNS